MEEFLASEYRESVYGREMRNVMGVLLSIFFSERMEEPLKLKFIYAKITRIYIHNIHTI